MTCLSVCVNLCSSTTIKIDVAENRLHHSLVEPLQCLQIEGHILKFSSFLLKKEKNMHKKVKYFHSATAQGNLPAAYKYSHFFV